MSSYPSKSTHPWSSDVVGGASGSPLLFKLYETDLISNGSFEDVLSAWDGWATRQDFSDKAAHGNYVISVGAYAHTYFDRTSGNTGNEMNLVLFSGYVKASYIASGGSVDIRIYTDDGTSRIASPSNYVELSLSFGDSSIVFDSDDRSQWIKFYVLADLTTMSGDYIHFDISSEDYATMDYYLDNLKIFECFEVVTLADPNVMKLRWQRRTDANYELANGDNKDFVRGWRPIFNLGYDYCSRDSLVKHIGITESNFNFFAPHSDSCNGEFVRMIEDFDSSYFKNKYMAHENELVLLGIHLRKYKNIEYGSDYWSLTEV